MTKSTLHRLLESAAQCDTLENFIDTQKSGSISHAVLEDVWTFGSGIDFRSLRKLSGLTQAKFSEKYGIPRRTIEEWDRQTRTAPPYLLEFILCDVIEEKNSK